MIWILIAYMSIMNIFLFTSLYYISKNVLEIKEKKVITIEPESKRKVRANIRRLEAEIRHLNRGMQKQAALNNTHARSLATENMRIRKEKNELYLQLSEAIGDHIDFDTIASKKDWQGIIEEIKRRTVIDWRPRREKRKTESFVLLRCSKLIWQGAFVIRRIAIL